MTAPTPAEQGAITKDLIVFLRAVLWLDCPTVDTVISNLTDANGVLHCLGHHYIANLTRAGLTDQEIAEALEEFARFAGLQDI